MNSNIENGKHVQKTLSVLLNELLCMKQPIHIIQELIIF